MQQTPVNLYRHTKIYGKKTENYDMFGTDGVNVYYSRVLAPDGDTAIETIDCLSGKQVCTFMTGRVDTVDNIVYRMIDDKLYVIISLAKNVLIACDNAVLMRMPDDYPIIDTDGIKNDTGYFSNHIGYYPEEECVFEYRLEDRRIVRYMYYVGDGSIIAMTNNHIYYSKVEGEIMCMNKQTKAVIQVGAYKPTAFEHEYYYRRGICSYDSKFIAIRTSKDHNDILSIPSFTSVGIYHERFTPTGLVDNFIVCNSMSSVIDRGGNIRKIVAANSDDDEFLAVDDGAIITREADCAWICDFTWNWRDIAIQTAEIKRQVILAVWAFKHATPNLGRDLIQLIIAIIMEN